MADSGLDQNSCFFREDSDEENIECSSYTSPVYDLTKRKVSAKQLDSLCCLSTSGLARDIDSSLLIAVLLKQKKKFA